MTVSSYSEPNVPALAVDGDLTTRWAQGLGLPDPSWLQVDLGAPTSVKSIVTNFELPSGYKYKLEYSLDAGNWSVFDDHTTVATSVRPAQVRAIRDAADASVEAHQDHASFREHDRTFHDAVAEASGNVFLQAAVSKLRDFKEQSDRLLFAGGLPGSLEVAAQQHVHIVEAIAAGDPDKAATAMIQHIDTTQSQFEQRIRDRLKGGISGALRIAHLAESFGLRAEVHGMGIPNQHLCMAIPNTTYYEALVWGNPIITDPSVDADGLIHASTEPGLS